MKIHLLASTNNKGFVACLMREGGFYIIMRRGSADAMPNFVAALFCIASATVPVLCGTQFFF